MSKRSFLVVALLVSGLVGGGVTWRVLIRPEHAVPEGDETGKKSNRGDSTIEDAYAAFVAGVAEDGIDEKSVRAELIATLRAWGSLPQEDRQFILESGTAISREDILAIRSIRAFLLDSASGDGPRPDAMLSDTYKGPLLGFFEGARQTSQRVRLLRKQIRQMTSSFLAVRTASNALSGIETDRGLPFLELVRAADGEPYADVRPLPEPNLPLFNDQEGIAVVRIERWLNSRQGQAALPIEQHRRLYRDGKLPVMAAAYTAGRESITEVIDAEEKRSGTIRTSAAPSISAAYTALKRFFDTLAKVGSPG
jgi:hypothetical protein